MPSLLHISASPRGARSESLAIARTFLDALRDRSSDITIDTFDLWDGTLPSFGPQAAAAKMSVFAGQQPAGEEAAAWQAAERIFRRFAAADFYLFSVPMWNHGIPYILKQFIDVVSQPGMIFRFDPQNGYTGLLAGKRAVVVYTSAVYGPAGRKASRRRLHERRLRTGAPGGVRNGFPGALPLRLAGLGRSYRHQRGVVPAEPCDRRRGRRPSGGPRRGT